MPDAYDDKSLEEWANFNFADEDSPVSNTEAEQTALLDAFVEAAPDSDATVTVEAQATLSDDTAGSGSEADSQADARELTSPPAFQGLEIPVAEVPIYKRPHMKGLFFGTGAFVVAIVVGAVFARGSSIELGQKAEAPATQATETEEKSEEELAQEKLSELEGEVAFGTLKNRAQILEEQKKQKILTGKLAKKAEEAQANQTASNTVQLPSQPVRRSRPSSSFSRLPVAPPTRVVPPAARVSSGSRPPGSLSSSPAPLPTAPVPPAPVAKTQESDPPTMLSFGSMPSNQPGNSLNPSSGSQSFGGFQTVAQSANESQGNPFDSDQLLAQQEDAFLSGKSQFLIESGQSLSGQVTQQIIAAQDAAFTVRVNEGVLGLPAGSEVAAQVTQFSGKYLVAEAVSVRHIDGSTTMIPPGAVTLSDHNGKLLKAKSNKGFFQSGFGKALLGAGSGIADQLTSRSESFSQSQFGTTVTRGAGSRDLATIGSSALRGFADPFLNQGNDGSGSSALLLNPGQKVRLNINSSFVVTQ